MIFETHAHYDDDRFKDDRDETIKRVHEKGVAPIINVGASIGSTMTTIELYICSGWSASKRRS